MITRFWRSKHLPAITVAGSLFGIFLTRAAWDPDPHHDGVMYAAAIAVREGLLPNRDVFAQYGPLVPEIQGVWLKFFGPTLIHLRILNALLLVAIGFLLFTLARKRVGSLTAALIVLAWALTSPRPCLHSCSNLTTLNNLPWPSVFSTLIIMAALYLLDSVWTVKSKPKIRNLIFGLIGVLMIAGSFARIQLFASFLVVAILLFWKRKREIHRAKAYSFLFGGLISALVSATLLIESGIWGPFLNQSIVWSFDTYGKSSVSHSTLIDLLWYPTIAAIFLSLWAIISWSIRTQKKVLKIPILLVPTALFLIAFLNLNLYSTKFSNAQVQNENFLLDASSNLLSCVGFISVAYILYQISPKRFRNSSLLNHRSGSDTERGLVQVVSLGIAATTLLQLYPLFDPLHLWWITPVLIAAILIGGTDTLNLLQSHQPVARSILIGLAIAGLFQLTMNARVNRIPFHDPALQGMKASPEQARRLDSTMQMLSTFGTPRRIKFFCSDGLYAAAGGKYLASGGNFVDWGDMSAIHDEAEYQQVFVCNVRSSSIRDFQQIGWTLISSTESEAGDGINALFMK